MKSILSRIIKHKYKLLKFLESIILNDSFAPNPLYLIESPRLAELIIKEEPFYPMMMKNPNPGLVKYIKELRDKLSPFQKTLYDSWVRQNPNPEIIKFVESTLPHLTIDEDCNAAFDSEAEFNNPDDIFKSDNPKYFDFIKTHPKINYEVLMMNPSEEMAEFILSNIIRFKFRRISRNCNPGLTKYFLDNEDKIDYYTLSYNTNSALAPLMLRNIHKLDRDVLVDNSNDGIVDYLLENVDKFDFSKCVNTNPKMAELIIKFAPGFAIVNSNAGLTEYNLKTITQDDCYALHNTNPKLFDVLKNINPDDVCVADRNPELWYYMTGEYSDNYLAKTNNRKLIPLLEERVELGEIHHTTIAANPIIATIDTYRTDAIINSLL